MDSDCPGSCSEYEKQYPGIVRLINQENAGPGSTVNRGIENAAGKYFRMVDADDWVGDGFEEYVNALKKTDADMIVTNYTCVDDKTNDTRFIKINGLESSKEQKFDDVCRGLSLKCTRLHSVPIYFRKIISVFSTVFIQIFNICCFRPVLFIRFCTWTATCICTASVFRDRACRRQVCSVI